MFVSSMTDAVQCSSSLVCHRFSSSGASEVHVFLGQLFKKKHRKGGPLPTEYHQRFYKYCKIGSCPFLRAQSTWRLERKNINNGVISPYPFRSVVYSGLAAAECTFWELAWLAKNCAQVKCRLKVRAGLSYQSTHFGIIKSGHRCNYLRFLYVPIVVTVVQIRCVFC